jgi:hypothetical protein
MEWISRIWNAIEYVFTYYFGWGYFYFSAGYFCYDKFNISDTNMRTFRQRSYAFSC